MGRFQDWLLRRYPVVLVGVGLLLNLPSLWGGLEFDDLPIRATILDCHPIETEPANPWHPFRFLNGRPELFHALVDRGLMPWWTDPDCRLGFLRPVTAATHIVDHRLWPGAPWLMHLQSLAWFALLILATSHLYRRLMARSLAPWVPALAALLFTVDDAHALPVVWLANRNSLLAALFGVLALVAHDRWRRDGWRPGAVLAPLALLVALLSKESAVSVGAYLLGYAAFLDEGTWRRRLATLLPCLLVGVVWHVLYRAMGFGIYGSGVYIDPVADPAGFLREAAVRAPMLLLGQWGVPAADLGLSLSTAAFRGYLAWAVIFLLLLGGLLTPLIARSRLARFWTTGMLLSLLPACVAFPSDRLLMYVGLGGMGLLAEFLGGLREDAAWMPRSAAWRWPARGFACLFVLIHLVLAPLGLLFMAVSMPRLGEYFDHLADTLPHDASIENQTFVYVNSATLLADIAVLYSLDYRDHPLPARTLSLNAGCAAATIARLDDRTIAVRPFGGYLAPRGTPGDAACPLEAVSPAYFLRHMDLLVRGPERPMRRGETIDLSAVAIEVTELTEDGRPAEVTFRFRTPLEDPSLRWFRLTLGGYVPFQPPAVGETVRAPALL
jgi:hypothetical protein